MALTTPPSHPRTPATDRAFEAVERMIEADIAGHAPSRPRGVAFVPADLPELGEILKRHREDHRSVVLVYSDGTEDFLRPPPPELVGVLVGAITALSWGLIRSWDAVQDRLRSPIAPCRRRKELR